MTPARRGVLHLTGVLALAGGILLGCGQDETASTAPASVENSAENEVAVETTAARDAVSRDDSSNERTLTTVPVFIEQGNPELLSDWAQLSIDGGGLAPAPGVTPYTLQSPLFSDHALKLRTVWFPDGAEPATYDSEDVFSFPVGTVITKTFYYRLATAGSSTDWVSRQPATNDLHTPIDLAQTRLVETRVLAHREGGWVALPYVWNDEQTDAELKRAGDLVQLTLVDESPGGETPFPYVVPNSNQCAGCHATNHTTGLIQPIGPKARHLNTDVDLGDVVMPQLSHWVDVGLVADNGALSDAPEVAAWDDPSASLDARARAYLDINCSHCHNKNGPADTSGLFLESTTEYGPRLGVCKGPVAAGTGTGNRLVGIAPGEPDESIFVFRMTTTDPGAMMPELGRAIVHEDGVALISEWIESLDGSC